MYIEFSAENGNVAPIIKDLARWVKEDGHDNTYVHPMHAEASRHHNDHSYVIFRCNHIEIKRGFSGENPIFYSINNNQFLVSDRASAIAKRVNAPVCVKGCYEYIYFEYPGDGRTLYDGVVEVKNSETILIDIDINNNLVLSKKDSFCLHLYEDNESTEIELARKLRQHISNAHAKRASDTNGILLSGGIDSQVMAIALKRDLGIKDAFATTFSVRGASQNETQYARQVSSQLGIEWINFEVEPEADIDWSEVINANSPYIGAIAMQQLMEHIHQLAGSGTVLFAGQDTRLHTPALGRHDLLLWKYYFRSGRLADIASKCARGIGKITNAFEDTSYLKRVVTLFINSRTFNEFLVNRYFHVRRFDFNVDDNLFKEIFDEIVTTLGNVEQKRPRAAYNAVVKTKWRRQDIFDVNHMVGSVENASMHCALPFYDYDLSQFSASIPFALATKMSFGRAGHMNTIKRVNKYILRRAYEAELDPRLIYRDKAVCATNHLFLNGALNHLIEMFISDKSIVNSEVGRLMHFPELQKICIKYKGNWTERDNWLGNIIFNALVVWSLLSTEGLPYSYRAYSQ